MTRITKFTVFVLLLFPVIASGQNNSSFTIDTAAILTNKNLGSFVQSLKTDSFQNFPGRAAIPGFIKKQLTRLADGFSIANPGKPWQCCCMSPKRLPARQLDFLAKSNDVLVMTYKTGGLGVATHLLLVRFADERITDLWSGYCMQGIKTVGEIVSFIEESRKNNRELNTNIIIL